MRWIALALILVWPCWLSAEDAAAPAQDVVPPAPAAIDGALTLDECVVITMMRHPRLVEAGAQIDVSRGLATQSGLYPNPRLDSGNPQTIGPAKATVLTTGLTQEVITAGKLKLEYAAAQDAARQAEWNRLKTHFDVLTDVRQQFFSTLAAQRRQSVLENMLALSKQSEKRLKNLFDGEQVPETDFLLIRNERRKAELALRQAETTLGGQKRQLAATMGVDNSSIPGVDGSLTIPLPAFEDDQVVSQVLYGNSLVHMALLDISRSQFLLRRAEVEPIPNLSVQGGFQYSYNPIDARGDHTQGLVGIYVNVPLWNFNQGNVFAAQAAVRRANAARAIVQQDLTKQLADAMARYKAAEQGVKAYEEGIVPDAVRTLELVKQAYERGQFDILKLLQTQRSLFEANLDYISALENRLTAAAEIAGLLQMDDFP